MIKSEGTNKDSLDLQPTCNQLATDLISRQAAIDAFGLSEKTRKYGGDHSGYETRMLYEIQDTLESLPSAQPEIIRCKDCKHCSVDFIGDYVCNAHRMEVIEDDDYCSYGKRKEKCDG